MNKLQVNARLKIKSGHLDRFKELGETCLKMVKEKDTGTLQYDWFLSEDKKECVVREIYRDSEALLDHMGNLGPVLGELLEISAFSGEFYGDASPELRKALDGMDVSYYSYFQGL